MARNKKKEEPKVEVDVNQEEPKVEVDVNQEEPKVLPSFAAELGPKKIKVTPEELQELQKEGKLIGWNPATGEALIK